MFNLNGNIFWYNLINNFIILNLNCKYQYEFMICFSFSILIFKLSTKRTQRQWQLGETSSPNTQIMVSTYHFLRKKRMKTTQINSSFHTWVRKYTRWTWDIVFLSKNKEIVNGNYQFEGAHIGQRWNSFNIKNNLICKNPSNILNSMKSQ